MADVNVQIKQRNGAVWDDLFPKTKAANVAESTTQRFVSDAEKAAWNANVSSVSPALTGIPTAPTAAAGTNTTQIATTAFIQAAIAALVNASPGALDTLDELAAALGDDANFAATMTNALALKAALASPTFTGIPAAPTAAADTSTTQVATTAFVVGQAATVAPVIDGTAAVGTSKKYAREDHKHPTDTTRAPLASPALTGIPTVPTAAVNTNTTQAASTAFAVAQANTRAKITVDAIEPTTPATGDFWYSIV